MTPLLFVIVALAGALGAVLRYAVGVAFARQGFPWAVLTVNVIGSALGGVFAAVAVSADVRLIVLTGLCGGLTTFSTFSVETVQLVLDGKARAAASSVALNLVLGVGACAAGYALFA